MVQYRVPQFVQCWLDLQLKGPRYGPPFCTFSGAPHSQLVSYFDQKESAPAQWAIKEVTTPVTFERISGNHFSTLQPLLTTTNPVCNPEKLNCLRIFRHVFIILLTCFITIHVSVPAKLGFGASSTIGLISIQPDGGEKGSYHSTTACCNLHGLWALYNGVLWD